MSDTPHTDREVYVVTKADIGFAVVNPSLCRLFEIRLATAWWRGFKWGIVAVAGCTVIAATVAGILSRFFP